MGETSRLVAERLDLRYDDRVVVAGLDLAVPDGRFSVIVGPNACGKSTLLRALARILRPHAGRVLLDGRAIHSTPAKAVARTLGMLPQSAVAPETITVLDLVGRGRSRIRACCGSGRKPTRPPSSRRWRRPA